MYSQSTFFPFSITSRLARGVALRLALDVPTYRSAAYGDVPVVDAVATCDDETGRAAVFLVNRSQTDEVTVELDVAALRDVAVIETHTLADTDAYAKNTLHDRQRVAVALG